MEHWREALSIFVLLFGSGAVAGLLRYIIRHDKKHDDIEKRLADGEEAAKKNGEDHERMEDKIDLQLVATKELLVHFDLRKPGQGINGEE